MVFLKVGKITVRRGQIGDKYSSIGRGVRDWNNLPREMFNNFPNTSKLFKKRLGKHFLFLLLFLESALRRTETDRSCGNDGIGKG